MLTITLLCIALAPQSQPSELATSMLRPPAGTTTTRFGATIEVDGDVALVDAWDNNVRQLWTYERQGHDWTRVDVIDGAALGSAFWPQRCFLSGDRFFTSQPIREYQRAGSTWTQVSSLPGLELLAVDFEHDRVVIHDSHSSYTLYERGAQGWHQTGALFGNSGGGGIAAGIEGDVAAIGTPLYFSCDHFANPGRLYILERASTGQWGLAATIEDDGPCASQQSMFGEHVAVTGGQVLATDRENVSGPAPLVRIFEKVGVQWSQQGTIEPSPGLPMGAVSPLYTPWVVEGDYLLSVAPAPTATRRLFQRTAAGWQFVRAYTHSGWPLSTPSWNEQNLLACDLYFVDAPAQTGIGRRAGVAAVGHLVTHKEVALFDPIVSASVCIGQPNSTGTSARLDGAGSDLLVDGRLTLVATALPTSTLVLPLVSSSFALIQNPGGSAGDLCLGTTATRLLGLAAPATAGGTFQAALDLNGLPQSPIQSGERLFFQLWYRDLGGNNFSNATAVQLF
jgi:hypothetical protein